jgi:hypothetical protein
MRLENSQNCEVGNIPLSFLPVGAFSQDGEKIQFILLILSDNK